MIDEKKAIERNKLSRDMQLMKKPELAALGDCDMDCPLHLRHGSCCVACNENGGWYKENDLVEMNLSESQITMIQELLDRPQGAIGLDGCAIKRSERSLACLKYLCNPFRKVAGINYG